MSEGNKGIRGYVIATLVIVSMPLAAIAVYWATESVLYAAIAFFVPVVLVWLRIVWLVADTQRMIEDSKAGRPLVSARLRHQRRWAWIYTLFGGVGTWASLVTLVTHHDPIFGSIDKDGAKWSASEAVIGIIFLIIGVISLLEVYSDDTKDE